MGSINEFNDHPHQPNRVIPDRMADLALSHALRTKLALVAICLAYAISMASWLDIDYNQQATFVWNITPTDFYFEPYFLTQILRFVETSLNPLMFGILSTIIFPTITFILIILTFRRFINDQWAILMALIGVSFIEEYPFRLFVFDILQDEFSLLAEKSPILQNFPFPSLTVLIAVFAVFIISKQEFISFNRALISTIVVAGAFYIHAINSAFIIVFWLIYYLVRCVRQYGLGIQSVLMFAAQILVFLLLISYGVFNADFSRESNAIHKSSAHYILLYWCIPIALTFTILIVRRIDSRDFFFRFLPVVLLLSLEVCVFFLDIIGFLKLNFDFLYQGFAQIFMHSFYFIPIIHYLSRGHNVYSSGIESSKISAFFSASLQKGYDMVENYFLVPLVIILLLYQSKWFLELFLT